MAPDTPNTDLLQVGRDRNLVKRMLAGDQRTFHEFIDVYFPRLYRYTRHRVKNEGDIEDIMQTVLSQTARRLETYRGEATLLTWLVHIFRHEVSRSLQKKNSDPM